MEDKNIPTWDDTTEAIPTWDDTEDVKKKESGVSESLEEPTTSGIVSTPEQEFLTTGEVATTAAPQKTRQEKFAEQEKALFTSDVKDKEEKDIVSEAVDATNRFYAERGGMTPFQKMNELQSRVDAIQSKYKATDIANLSQEELDKIEQEYTDEVSKTADELGLQINEDGSVKPYDEEVQSYRERLNSNTALAQKSKEKKAGFGENLLYKLSSGYERAASNVIDLLGVATGLNYFDSFKGLSEGAKYNSEQLSKYANRYDDTIQNYLMNGEIGKAAGAAFSGAVESLPAMLPVFINPTTGLGVMSGMSGIDKFREIEDANIPEWSKYYNAFITGASEYAGEKLVTLPILARSKQAILKLGEKKGKQAIETALKKSIENNAAKLGRMPEWVAEGLSEVATGISTDLVDKVTVNPELQIGSHAIDDFAVGAVMGKVFALPQDLAKGMDKLAARDFAKNVVAKLPDDMDIETKISLGWKIAERDRLVEAENKLDEKFKGKYQERIVKLNTEIDDIAQKYSEQTMTVGTTEADSGQQEQLDYLKEKGVEIPDGTTTEQLKALYGETKAKAEPKITPERGGAETLVKTETETTATVSGESADVAADEITPERVEKEAAKKVDGLEQKKADIERKRKEELASVEQIPSLEERLADSVYKDPNKASRWRIKGNNFTYNSKKEASSAVESSYKRDVFANELKSKQINAKYDAELAALEKVEQIKEKQDGINGDERTEEVQGKQLQLGEKPEDQVTETGEKAAEAGAAEEVSFEPFAEVVRGSKTLDEAFKKVSKIKDVTEDVSAAFRQKYDPNGNLTPKKAFEVFYNEIKSQKPTEAAIEPLSQPEGQIIQPEEKVAETGEKTTPVTSTTTINRDYKKLKEKLGEKKVKKYFQEVDKLFNPIGNEIVEYRPSGVVIKKGDKYEFHALADMDLKTWRKAEWKPIDVTDQFVSSAITPEKEGTPQAKVSQKRQQAKPTAGNVIETEEAAQKVEKEPTKVAEIAKEEPKVVKATGIKPTNIRDVYKAGRDVFGLNKAQALAQAIVVDNVIGKIAKRRGVTKEKVYSEIEFRKSTMEDLKKGRALYQQDMAKLFYSPTEKALKSIQQNKGTAEQFKAMLLKNGAKQAELDWMGWDDVFQKFGRQAVITKLDIQAWIDENKVEIEEVTKGGKVAELGSAKAELVDDTWYVTFENGAEIPVRKFEADTEEEAISVAREEFEADVDNYSTVSDTKYSQYQLPGGLAYKEVLLTMPNKTKVDFANLKKGDKFIYNGENVTIVEDEFIDSGQVTLKTDGGIRFIANISDVVRGVDKKSGNINEFKSSHWDEPNILAHIRFNERTDSEGNKVLFIEEIQSDWAQKGKKEGFTPSKIERKKLVEEHLRVMSDQRKIDERIVEVGDSTDPNRGRELFKLAEIKFELEKKSDELRNKIFGKVPDMPFKQTPQWVNLALRRMIRYAAENGFDRIAWTTGEIQAERYDLSKQVDAIDYKKRGDDKYTVQVRKGDNNIWAKREATISEIEDTVGKEIASKIQSQATDELQTLSGLDLKVGGQGMKAFYDAIVPNAAKELGKKFGAKVEETEIPMTKQYEVARNTEDIKKFTKAGYTLTWNGNPITKQRAYEIIERGAQVEATPPQSTPVMSMPITESMRQTALTEGMPLFQKQKTAGTARGAIQFLEDGRAIISAMTNPNVSTPLHEIAHLYEKYMTTDERQAVLNWTGDKTWSVNTSEKFARGFENYLATGKAPRPSLQKVFDRFKKWLTEIYNGIVGSEIDLELNDAMRDVYAAMLGEDVVPKVSKKVKQERVEPKSTGFADVDALLFQMESVPETITVDGVQRPTINSKGQYIYPTLEGIKNFWKWFGDSKVVDKKGRPLVVYHGTTYPIEEFKKEKLGSKNVFAESAYEGFFFAQNPLTSNEYTSDMMNIFMGASLGNQEIIDIAKKIQDKYRDESNLIERKIAEISKKEDDEIQSLLEQSFPYFYDDKIREQIENDDYFKRRVQYNLLALVEDSPKIKEIKDKYDTSELINERQLLTDKINSEVELEYNASKGRGANIIPVYLSIPNLYEFDFGGEDKATDKFTDVIKRGKEEGNDGVVLQNVKDGADIFDNIYIAFEPSQIKSATGNQGTFDAGANILFQEDKTEKHTKAVNLLIDKAESAKEDVEKFVREKLALAGNPVSEKIITNVLKERGYASTQQGRPLQDSGDETGEGRGQRDSDLSEVNGAVVQDREKAEEKVSPKYAGRVNSRAGIRYAYGEGFSESAKQAYRDNKLYEYTPEHHEEVAQLAQSIFDLNGANETEKIYYNKNIPRRVRVGIGLLLVKHYSGLANEAAKNGNMDEADKWDDKTNAMYKSIQDDIATEAGRDVSFFGSEFVKALLTPYGTARSIQRGMEKQRSDIENSKMYKNDVESIVEEVGKLRDNVIAEIQKSKKYEEIKRRHTEPKNAKVAAIKEKRNKLIDKLKKTTQLSSSVVGLSSEQIEILGEIAYTYIEEGVVRVTDLVKKIKKAAKAAGVTLSDEQAKSVLPDEIKGTKITDLEKQEAIEDAAAQLAMREFGMVIDRKSSKDNPLLAMVNTLTAKFSERAEKGKKPTPKSTMDKVVAAIVNKSEYMDVWKEAKDIALQQVDDMKVDDETKKEYKRRINDAYKNATEFSVSEKQVQELIRKSLSEREMSIDDVIRGHYSKREIYLEDLKRDLVQKSGLTAENAAELADAVDNAFNTIMTEKGTKLIDRYVRYKTKPKTTVERKTEAASIIELINIGAFDSQNFRDVFANVYGIPTLEKEDKDYIVRKGKLLQMTKGDAARANIEQAMMSHILNLKGFDAAEYATALWYAHILSGITTQMRNVMDAMTSTLIETMHLAGGNRSDIKRVIDAHLKNFSGEGWYRLQEAMLTGVSPVVGKKYVDMPSALERWKFVPDIKPEDTNADIAIKKSMTKLANMYTGLAKYIPRTMVAPDALFFTSAKEAVAQTLVSQSERKQLEKLKGRKLNKEELKQLENTIATKLAMTPAQTAQIRKQVEEESKEFAKNQQDLGEKPRTRTVVENGKKKNIEYYGYSPTEAKIREYELRDQMRGVDVMEKAITIAGRMTGNTDMYGTMGYLIDFISRGLKGFTMIINKPVAQKVKGKYQFSWNPTDKIRTHPLKFIMPFTNIVSNVITRNMGWTVPIGIMRAATGKFGRFAPEESRYRVEMSPEERARLWQKVMKIVIIQAGLYGLMAAINGDDDEPYVEISLDGTGDYDKNKQLEAKGWRPYSIRVGNQSFDYRQLGGLAAVFMVLGYMNDRKRYTDNDDSELELYAKAMGVSLGYLLKATPLYGVNKAMDWMTYAFRGDERNAMKSLAKLAGGIGTGFVSPKTLSEMEDVMKFMGILDREKTNPESFMAKLMQYVPFVGDPLARGRVAIDKFGEPIDATLSTAAIIRRVEQDPLKMYYINQGYFAPEFNMSRQEFELWDGGKRVKRVLNPNNKYEVALANSYEIILGQKFKQAVENAMQRGLEGEKFVEEMESKYRDFQKESKKQIFSLTVQDPVEATDDAIEID